MNERMLTLREICAAKRTSAPTVYRLIARGILPPGERTGLRAVRWRESVVEEAYARLNADRPSEATAHFEPVTGLPSPTGDLEAAATWLASQDCPTVPVIPHLRTVFGLTALEACEVAARAFELRASR